MLIFLVLLGLVGLVVVTGIALYNRLVRMRNTVQSAWADIDVFLKKRYNLVDNLVETVKGYASHEKTTLSEVIATRARAMQSSRPGDKAQAENMLTGTLKSLFALSESYPDLKADGNFLKLQEQIHELENTIEKARRYYNAVVRDYNILTEAFPSNIVASIFSFTKEEFFELQETAAREPVKVEF